MMIQLSLSFRYTTVPFYATSLYLFMIPHCITIRLKQIPHSRHLTIFLNLYPKTVFMQLTANHIPIFPFPISIKM